MRERTWTMHPKTKNPGSGKNWAASVKDKHWAFRYAPGCYGHAWPGAGVENPACPIRKICIRCLKAEQVKNKLCGVCNGNQ